MEKKNILPGEVYDVLKWCAILFLPALAIFVKTVFGIWHIPYGEEISGTIIALQVFLGAVLGVSSLQYKTALTPAPESVKIEAGGEADGSGESGTD